MPTAIACPLWESSKKIGKEFVRETQWGWRGVIDVVCERHKRWCVGSGHLSIKICQYVLAKETIISAAQNS